jgi:hypothetical protein
MAEHSRSIVMAGLVPAIHVLRPSRKARLVDARDKRGHDGGVVSGFQTAGSFNVIPGRCGSIEPGMTSTGIHSRDAIAPEFCKTTSLWQQRAQGMPGAPLAPIALRANRKDTQAEVTTGQAASHDIPRAMVLRFPSCSPRCP